MRAVGSSCLLVVVFAVGCSKPELAPPDTKPKAEPQAIKAAAAAGPVACGTAKDAKTYGTKPQSGAAVDVAKVLGEPDKFADKPVLIQGRVRSACTKKGCWMELADAAAKDAVGTRVTFKDYGFFVPTTSAGKAACVEGVVSSRRVSPEEVTHLEAEGARFPSKMPDGSAREVRIVATGVDLWDG